ncbi:glycosyltransferase [Dyadobacter fanqingshengii]|uniref:Glycosyltransferase n=1 Tax=Dyadobacter fanqingshengii TaxID=2906443 RepID=A0A9X1TBD6_9BACT|nr:glycosyltransferase [Dyadobacter fanqingshengii]MCF0041854.1 glycosyltransferase [Dyadobacter fanqingshengii]USJ36437.1 glycosyltransferase [Dyadobacter fanqingshengii]
MEKEYIFNGVTLLITHYNRSQSLEQLLRSFAGLHCKFEDIVVSDDGSKSEHIDYLHSLQNQFNFRLITTPHNKGLGNNINKGQDAVQTPLTLYVQEDFTPAPIFPEKFQHALRIMKTRQEIDMVRFYAYFEYPYLTNEDNGFYDMAFNVWKPGYRKFYMYSDHPHLRRTSFFQKFGRYIEGQKGDFTEYTMMMSFLKKKGKAVFYKDFTGLFTQRNSEVEPSTMKRENWRLSENFFLTNIRHLYRHLKFNFDYLS